MQTYLSESTFFLPLSNNDKMTIEHRTCNFSPLELIQFQKLNSQYLQLRVLLSSDRIAHVCVCHKIFPNKYRTISMTPCAMGIANTSQIDQS